MQGTEFLNVYACPAPFSVQNVKIAAPLGSTLADIVNGINVSPAAVVLVSINSYPIPQEIWHNVKPKLGAIVNVKVLPAGGKGGKSPIVSLISIAVLVAAPYAGAALSIQALNAGLGLTAAQGIFLGKALAVGIGVVGLLVANALAPPPKPISPGVVNNPSESPTQFIEGASNALDPYGVVPVCLGTNRMFPKKAARGFTENIGNKIFSRDLFTYGFGKVNISDIKIGETSISQYSGVQMEHRLDADLNLSTELYPQDVIQDPYNVLLSQATGYVTRTTQIDVDEAIIDVTFPQGLAQFNDQGQRNSKNVQIEVQFSSATDSPTIWSPAAVFTFIPAKSFSPLNNKEVNFKDNNDIAYRADVIGLNRFSGEPTRITGTLSADNQAQALANAPNVDADFIRIATVLLKAQRSGFTQILTIENIIDNRTPDLFGTVIENTTDFAVTSGGSSIDVAAGSYLNSGFNVTAATTEALRETIRIIFPVRGTYNIRFRRLTADNTSDQVFDEAFLTAIKNVKYAPPITLQGISGTALRLQASDQLTGQVEQFNCVVSNIIPNYNPDLDEWIDAITSNPASIYVYVLQGGANSKPVSDSQIDWERIQEWHVYCDQQGYSYNRVIDYETNVDDILRDVAAAGAASPHIRDGLRSVVIDKPKDDIVTIVTPRNSSGYSAQLIYPTLPHAFRVQFRNAQKGYQVDERIVYDDGYSEFNATEFETLEAYSCTNSVLAFKTGRRHLASIKLRPEVHTFIQDVENLVLERGNRFKLVHDVPLVGAGDGRVKEVFYSNDSPTLITGFLLDDTVSIPNSSQYYARIRRQDGTQLYKAVVTSIGNQTSFDFLEPLTFVDNFYIDDLTTIVETGGELDLVVTRIEPSSDFTAKITAVDYAPDVFIAENSAVPNWVSKLSVPLQLVRPNPPVLSTIQSDESVALLQPDGSILTRAVINLVNPNNPDLFVDVQVRASGDTSFSRANLLEASPQKVIITGLQEDTTYDIHIRYRQINGSQYSVPLQINSYRFLGLATPPDDVTGYLINVTGSTAIHKWDANNNLGFSHYEMRYSNAFTGATFENAQLIEEFIYENRITLTFQPGTYLIKAVNRLNKKSVNATTVITYNPSNINNAVADLIENPNFDGFKDNVVLTNDGLIQIDSTQPGYYYFDQGVILDGFYECILSAALSAGAVYSNNLYSYDDLYLVDDLYGAGENDLYAIADLYAIDDLYGIGLGATRATLEYQTYDGNPSNSANLPSEWQEFVAGSKGFYAIFFRIKIESFVEGVSSLVTEASARVDMPDRIERGEDITVPDAGINITFSPAFRAMPSIVVTIQSGDGDDEVRITSKTAGGFNLRIYNKASSTYVSRICDYIASGYGRKN